MHAIRVWFCLSLFVLICAVCALGQQTNSSSATVPSLVNYSGLLNDGSGKPLTGFVGVTFALYREEQGGSPLWLETQNVQADARGHYSVRLGSASSTGLPHELFVAGEARWLGVQVQGQAEQARVMLLSVPYAMKAGDAATVGGLPPSAFVLAPPALSNPPSNGGNENTGSAPAASVVSGSGTANFVPLWFSPSILSNSALFQSGSGNTANLGINTTTPAATLDVNGGVIARGALQLPSTGTATSGGGFNSQPFSLQGSSFNSGTGKAIGPLFQWQTEPSGNNTSNPLGTLNLLYGNGSGSPSETGLNISSNGQITFATGQTFPGTGSGTVTSVGSGAGLTGGPITGSGTLSIATGGVTNAMLTNPFLTVAAGTDLTGGGSVSLGGTTTLNLDTTKVPQLGTANTFTGNQTVNGNLSATGTMTSSGFQIGSYLFAFGNANNANAFLGFSGNSTTTGIRNTATGWSALNGNTTGNNNDATGTFALANNTTGIDNTAMGTNALISNTIGSDNTGTGSGALYFNTAGIQNTADGFLALSANSTGAANTATGFEALISNNGSQNTANGWEALYSNTAGTQNTATGVLALFSNTSGGGNTAEGMYALNGNTSGNSNTATGEEALYRNTTGGSNTAVGVGALNSNTSGIGNTGVGNTAGFALDGSNMTGNGNTFLGAHSSPSTGTLTNATAIGTSSEVSQSNAIVLGGINGVNGATSDTNVGIGTTAPSNPLTVVGNSTYIPVAITSPSAFGTWMTLTNSSSGGATWNILSAASGNSEGAGNLAFTNFNPSATVYIHANLQVDGTVSKGGGSFQIDHPLDPANKFLYHSFVESPDMMNVYNGNVMTNGRGLAVVVLPDYFEALNRDFRYQLTVIGQFAQAIVAREISHNRFTIRTSRPGVKVSWQVTGIRHDAYADAHRIPNEEEKPPQEQGHFLHPELFGAPPEMAIGVQPPSSRTVAANAQ